VSVVFAPVLAKDTKNLNPVTGAERLRTALPLEAPIQGGREESGLRVAFCKFGLGEGEVGSVRLRMSAAVVAGVFF